MAVCDGCGRETATQATNVAIFNGGTSTHDLCAPCAEAREADPVVMVGPLSVQRVMHLSEVVRQLAELDDPMMADALDQYEAEHPGAVADAYACLGLQRPKAKKG